MYESALLFSTFASDLLFLGGKAVHYMRFCQIHTAKEPQGQCLVHVSTSKKQTKQLVKQRTKCPQNESACQVKQAAYKAVLHQPVAMQATFAATFTTAAVSIVDSSPT